MNAYGWMRSVNNGHSSSGVFCLLATLNQQQMVYGAKYQLVVLAAQRRVRLLRVFVIHARRHTNTAVLEERQNPAPHENVNHWFPYTNNMAMDLPNLCL